MEYANFDVAYSISPCGDGDRHRLHNFGCRVLVGTEMASGESISSLAIVTGLYGGNTVIVRSGTVGNSPEDTLLQPIKKLVAALA